MCLQWHIHDTVCVSVWLYVCSVVVSVCFLRVCVCASVLLCVRLCVRMRMYGCDYVRLSVSVCSRFEYSNASSERFH